MKPTVSKQITLGLVQENIKQHYSSRGERIYKFNMYRCKFNNKDLYDFGFIQAP